MGAQGDAYIKTLREPVDGVLWDLAVGTPEVTAFEMMIGRALVRAWLGDVPMVQFGVRRRALEFKEVNS